MSTDTGAEVALRLIGRDQAMRAGGKTPPWGSVRQILDFVCQRQLLSDPVVARWLGTLAGDADVWFSQRLLEAVAALLNGEHADQAHALYRLVLGLDDAARWSTVALALASEGLIADAAIEPILCRSGLLVRHAQSWGRTACELLGRVVREQQRKEWPSHLSFLAAVAEHLGEPFDADQPFEPREDDSPTLWYFAPDRPDAPRTRVARAVEAALREAAQLAQPEAFQLFAGWLLEQEIAVGTGMLLAALLDGLTGKLPAQPWHAAEAARLLALDQVQRPPSLGDFRQLLRRAIPRPDEATAVALTDVIRRSALPESARLRELGDVAAWGTLRPEEQAMLAEASARGELDAPSDPRTDPVIRRGELTRLPPVVGGRTWPHPEDASAIEDLSEMSREQEPRQGEAIDHARLDRRLRALQTLTGREACNSEGWLGEILGWCHDCITLLRREELVRLGRDPDKAPLSASEWEAVLSPRATWWQGRAEAALVALAGAVPDYHRERRPGGLSWSTSDVVLQSLAYLDEVLAVVGDGPFERLRFRMESAVDEAWPNWPSFTRATALSALRAWYWHNLGRLRARLTQLVAEEEDPVVLRYAVDRVLRIGGPDLGANLGRFLDHAPQVESSGEMVNQIALVVIGAYLFGQEEANPGGEVRQLSELFLRLQQAPPEHASTREALIRGLLFGAFDLFKDQRLRTPPRADAWAALVVWACSSWPWSQEPTEKPERFPILPVTAVLALSWPEGLRRRMISVLQGCFLRIMRDGAFADFCWLHHEIRGLLRGDGQGTKSRVIPLDKGDFSDELLIELCRASADRVAAWRAAGTTTRDFGWGAALTGHETADLIRAVLEAASDRNYLRRELPPLIDRLAEHGSPGIATELRLLLRRG
jgi:hypothetical protein